MVFSQWACRIILKTRVTFVLECLYHICQYQRTTCSEIWNYQWLTHWLTHPQWLTDRGRCWEMLKLVRPTHQPSGGICLLSYGNTQPLQVNNSTQLNETFEFGSVLANFPKCPCLSCNLSIMHTSAFRGAEPILKAAKLASVAPLLQAPTGLSSSSLDKNVATIGAKWHPSQVGI